MSIDPKALRLDLQIPKTFIGLKGENYFIAYIASGILTFFPFFVKIKGEVIAYETNRNQEGF